MTQAHLDHGDMVHNILSIYDAATEHQVQAGRAWYPTAGKLAKLIAEQTSADPVRVAYAISALSPRNPWRWNIADAYAFASARTEGRTMPRATTFKRNQLNAWQALGQDSAPWTTAAPKVRAFVAAILGDHDSVVVDVWAYRVATLRSPKNVVREAEYGPIAHAYNVAANLRGEAPAHMQAIVWLVAQSTGLAVLKPSNHAQVFKAGTPEFIREAMA